MVIGLLFGVCNAFSQNNNLLITVKDALTGEHLPNASVIYGEGKGVTTNDNGEAVINADKELLEIEVSYLGYKSIKRIVNLTRKKNIVFSLQPLAIQTNEIIINAENDQLRLRNNETGITRLNISELSDLPDLLGETDVLKSIQLLPGVQSGGEGSTGFLVRGGSIDQNLILMDGIPIYNSSHLFGFFSIFNPYTVSGLTFIKSGFSARYGGRVSSVLDIQSKMPARDKPSFESSIGLLSTAVSLDQPVVKKKLGFKISARRTYIDLLSKMFFSEQSDIRKQTDYYFGDLNLIADYLPGEKDRLTLTAYAGVDDFNYSGKNEFSNQIHWNNTLGGLNWKHTFNKALFTETLVYLTDYEINFGAILNTYDLDIYSSIRDLGIKNDWSLDLPGAKHSLTFGMQFIDHRFVPNNFDIFVDDEPLETGQKSRLYGFEGGAYVEDDFDVNEKLSLRVGLRYNFYQQNGPFTRYISDENYILEDTITYGTGEQVQWYGNFEPRFSTRYLLNDNSALKFSLDLTSQYIHLAPISSVSLPTDVWVPSSSYIKPQSATQYSLVYNTNIDDQYEASASLYYKKMNKLVEYRNGVVLGYGAGYNYDDNFVFGNSDSYGLELFLSKTVGQTTGWISYMLSKTDRKFEELNDGQPFPAKYDRRHNINFTLSYELNDRWTLSGLFVYSTGNALTIPVGRYVINGNVINDYAGRNNFRMPPYNRLDLSAELKSKPGKKIQSSWVFSIYNVYSRQNPYYIYFDIEGDLNEYNLEIEPKQVSLFPVLPSISYKIKL